MPERLLRLPKVLERVGASRSTWYHWRSVGLAPAPVRIGGTVAWPESQIDAWIAEHIRAANDGATRPSAA